MKGFQIELWLSTSGGGGGKGAATFPVCSLMVPNGCLFKKRNKMK